MSWKGKLSGTSGDKSSSSNTGGTTLPEPLAPIELEGNPNSTPSSSFSVRQLRSVASFAALSSSAQQWSYHRGAQSAETTTKQIEADMREVRNIIANYALEPLEILHLVDRWIQQLLYEFLQQRDHFKHQLGEIRSKQELSNTQI
ncbi:hypothetical protein I4U23_004761 [Adineta vaga]|nr:hypothetical protein I4U23_004761 [Adineta vaga]